MEKIVSLIFFSYLCGVLGTSSYYSTYYGILLNDTEAAAYVTNGTSGNCTILVETCNSTEGRRIDGTCNNLDNPSYGAVRTPYVMMLPPTYNQTTASVFDPQLAVDGSSKPLARVVRTGLFAEGRVDSHVLTSAVNHFNVFYVTDITNTRDTTNYLSWRTYCCTSAGANDTACTPNEVPATDFVHRFSGIRCLNMTRPLTYQTSGCLPNTTTPLRMVNATPTFDLSPVYGDVVEENRRTYSGGQLVTVTTNNVSLPDTSKINLLLGVNFFGIVFFWRFHNYIATELAAVNPSWTDEQLFQQAREINIACAVQILYYELAPLLLGSELLIEKGVISDCQDEFRDVYNSSVLPQMSIEFTVGMRWFHTMQDGQARLYDANGTYTSSISLVNLTSNISDLKKTGVFAGITQGLFRQPAAGSDDYIVDPDIVEKGLGGLQKCNDIMTNDLAKSRYYGLQSYVYYRSLCFGDNITSFDDLSGIIDEERITSLKELYTNVADLDALAGIWAEKIQNCSHVPPTLSCIMIDQFNRTLVSDRHWYEREERPNPFTTAQLAEIRKITIASVICSTGDNVTEIQPSAFLLPTDDNVITSCDDIPTIDFTAWQDASDYDYE